MSSEKSFKNDVWKNIFRLIIPYRRKFLWVVFLGLLSTGASLVEPLIYREAINDVAGLFVRQARENAQKDLGLEPGEEDSIRQMIEEETPGTRKPAVHAPDQHQKGHVAGRSPRQALQTLLRAVLWLFIINLIGTLLWRLGENTNTRLSCLIEQRFIQSTFAHVLNLPLYFFTRRSSAAIAKQIDQSEEVTGIVNGFSQQILPELISLTGILAIMFWENVALTSVALITIPFYILIAWRSARKLETGLSSYYSRWEDVSSRIQDGLTGIKTVKLSGAEQREISQLQTISGEAYQDYIQRTRLANKYVFWETMLSHISTALVFGYGGYLTLENKLTPGDVVMFVAYLDRLYGPIDSLATLWVELQQNVASIARAFRLLDNGVEQRMGRDLKIREAVVKFESVHFSYTADREVLKGISFVLAPGKVTALVGGSGAGKTTTVDLLLKLYEPSAGRISIDDQDIRNLDAASVRGQIGMVSADGSVFRGSLAYNIRYKRPEATDEEVLQAALAAGLEGTLERLPDGLQTKVGEGGMGLSVGEKQRIQIARVLVARPRILILDEATSNLDYATEGKIIDTIDVLRKSSTVLVIAHKYTMVRDADHVIVLSEGAVLEEGSPAELIEKDGWFAEFARTVEEEDGEDNVGDNLQEEERTEEEEE